MRERVRLSLPQSAPMPQLNMQQMNGDQILYGVEARSTSGRELSVAEAEMSGETERDP